jgi:NAD(P)H-hydrate repair Nnr-like enzyme with NAD(P)H-hydrate dehydratase domain
VVLTPHVGEFVRLGGRLVRDDVAFYRIAAVRDLAARTGAVVLLKGPTTIVAHPHGHARLSDTGDARLATAGTGDVLTGVVAAFLAAGMRPLEAAASGAWVHGRAGTLASPVGLVASDLAQVLPDVLAAVASGAADPAASGMMGRAPGHRNPTRGPHHG